MGLSSHLFWKFVSLWVVLKFFSNAFVSTFLKCIPKCILGVALVTGSRQPQSGYWLFAQVAHSFCLPPVQVKQKIKIRGHGRGGDFIWFECVPCLWGQCLQGGWMGTPDRMWAQCGVHSNFFACLIIFHCVLNPATDTSDRLCSQLPLVGPHFPSLFL